MYVRVHQRLLGGAKEQRRFVCQLTWELNPAVTKPPEAVTPAVRVCVSTYPPATIYLQPLEGVCALICPPPSTLWVMGRDV